MGNPKYSRQGITALRVLRLWAWDVPTAEIADRLDIDEWRVRTIASTLRRRGFELAVRDFRETNAANRATYTRRPCLSCGASFRSEGIHHRVCAACKASVEWEAGDVEYPLTGG